jgi:hypothetical protein
MKSSPLGRSSARDRNAIATMPLGTRCSARDERSPEPQLLSKHVEREHGEEERHQDAEHARRPHEQL